MSYKQIAGQRYPSEGGRWQTPFITISREIRRNTTNRPGKDTKGAFTNTITFVEFGLKQKWSHTAGLLE